MKMRLFGLAFAGLMLAAGSPQAAVLSVTGGTPTALQSNFSLTAETGLANDGTVTVDVFNSDDDGFGLSLDSPATLKFEYLGSEASFVNTFDLGGQIFSNTASIVGATATAAVGMGLVPFKFTTSGSGGQDAFNGGPIPAIAQLSIAFADLGDGSFVALFNDCCGSDSDYDDLAVRISVSEVPLPPAVWLLLSAILGLVSFSRIRRGEAKAA